MKLIMQLLSLKADKRGVTALEYGMIAALIAVVCLGGFSLLGTNLSATLNTIAQNL